MTSDTTSAPRVSVVLTCFDLGRYLDEAVESVRAQTFRDFDLLIVDDGSTDPETLERLDGHRRHGTPVLRIDNRGLPGARNAGIRATRGDLVCCVDADDILEPTLLEKSVAALDADPGLTFVSHWLRAFGDEEWDWTPDSCDFPALLDVNTVNGAAPVRRAALEEVGFFDETLREGCEDWDLWITLVERGHRGAILPEFLFRYRRRADSMSRLMNVGAAHPALYGRIVAKHEESYRRHLPELWRRRAGVIVDHLRHTGALRQELVGWLEPQLDATRERLEHLRGRAARSDKSERVRRPEVEVEVAERDPTLEHEKARLHQLGEEYAAARHDLRSLKTSASWRVTAPLRALHRLLRGGPGGEGE